MARELLTESGSIFVQMNVENEHLVRGLLDEVFGADNFVTSVFFRKTSALSSPMARTNALASTADLLLWYARDASQMKYRQLYQKKTLDEAGGDHYRLVETTDGTTRAMGPSEASGETELPVGCRPLRADNLISQGHSPSLSKAFEFMGQSFSPAAGSHWKTTASGLAGLARAGRLLVTGRTLAYKRYFDDFPVMALTNVWSDIGSDPDKSYVVQTATTVPERCLLMTTDPGDLVLDPTCGSGTTAYVAEQWGRRWITIDTSRVALALARTRLMAAKYPYYLMADTPEGQRREAELTGAPPIGSTEGDIRKGFVYERVPHVTLKSIAQNPEIR